MFRELVADVDRAVFDTLSDRATVNGTPVNGMFSAPWLQPQFGGHRAGVRDPAFVVRAADVVGVAEGSRVWIDLPEPDGGDYTLVGLEPDGTGLVTLALRKEA